MYRRILVSSWSRFAYSLEANQRELQVRVVPSRNPIGWTFCPIRRSSSSWSWRLAALAGVPPAAAAAGRARAALAPSRTRAAGPPGPASARATVMWASRCRIQNARPIARGWIRLSDGSDHRVHSKVVQAPHLVVVLGVGDGRPQHLLEMAGRDLRRVLQDRQRLRHGLAADEVGDQARLAGRHADVTGDGLGEHGLPSYFSAVDFSVCEPCARKVRVGENSPSLCPTMFSVTYTGMNFLPLWTASVCPTVRADRRAPDHVLMTFFCREALSASTFSTRCESMNGPC